MMARMGTLVTLDFGTSYLKAALFDEAGAILALHRELLRPSTAPANDWELDPARLLQAVRTACDDLRTASPDGWRQATAISFATQTNSFVLLDAADRALTPIILWPDGRAADEPDLVAPFETLPGRHVTGVPALSAQFMLPKLAWLQRHEPVVWSQAARLCLLSDYVTLWLTGEHVTEAGAAGLTGLVDVREASWWAPACECARLSPDWLPRIVRAATDLGPLRPAVAVELALPETCRFVIGCLDQYAGAIGTGNVEPGGVSETTGTVLASVRYATRFDEHAEVGVFQGPGAAPTTFFQMCFGATSANLFEAFRNGLPDRQSFEMLDQLAAEVQPGCDGLIAVADETGRQVRFDGVPQSVGHKARAILEAVARALGEQVHRLCGEDCPPLIRSAGGAARSALWLQIKADMLGTAFAATTCPEPTSLGAAILAGSGIGWGTVAELAGRWVQLGVVHEPNPAARERYRQLAALPWQGS
ncbi:MAG: hypothetical protein JXA69_16500 [Phycisphaerae bacterium]|nr:hypothetical protein [Phycisphaerae bacterium]